MLLFLSSVTFVHRLENYHGVKMVNFFCAISKCSFLKKKKKKFLKAVRVAYCIFFFFFNAPKAQVY